MLTISTASLAGGQGKTTSSLFLARELANKGYKVLVVDCDPQAGITLFLRVFTDEDSLTTLEFLKSKVKNPFDCIYETDFENLYIIPSSKSLIQAQEYLAATGKGGWILKERLVPFQDYFDFCLIDSPPQKAQLSLAAIGAADYFVIPVEAGPKGIQSLLDTTEAIDSFLGFNSAQKLLGVVPFRDKWIGRSQALESRAAIEIFKSYCLDRYNSELIYPSILESEGYKKSMQQSKLLPEGLDLPFQTIVNQLEKLCPNKTLAS